MPACPRCLCDFRGPLTSAPKQFNLSINFGVYIWKLYSEEKTAKFSICIPRCHFSDVFLPSLHCFGSPDFCLLLWSQGEELLDTMLLVIRSTN